jgi:hypothetical protein
VKVREQQLKRLQRISDYVIARRREIETDEIAHAQAVEMLFDAGFRVCWEGRQSPTYHIDDNGRYYN